MIALKCCFGVSTPMLIYALRILTFFPSYHRRGSFNLSDPLKPRKVHSSNATKPYKRSISAETLGKQRILIIDDDSDILEVFKLGLERDGFMVDAFRDPVLALSNYEAGSYDLLLLDVKMPGLNGLELFERIRLLDHKAKVCFITAFEEFEYEVEIKSQFPDLEEECLIKKPISLHVLTQKLKSHLAM